MYISTNDIQTALDTRLATVAGLPTFSEENQKAQANGITAWCRSTLMPAKTTVQTLGPNPIMNQLGLYQVDLFFPVSYGKTPGRQMADAVIAAYPTGMLALPGGFNLIITSAWSLPGQGYSNQSAFWQIPIRVEWFINA